MAPWRPARCYEPGVHFSVRHATLYRYSVPVQLAVHRVRLNPRLEQVQLGSHTLDVRPLPGTRAERIDPFGNRVTELAFWGSTQQLSVVSRFELDTWLPPAIDTYLQPLPWSVDPHDSLQPYRWEPAFDGGVASFADDLARSVGYTPIAFLDRLAETLAGRTDKQLRLSGAAQPPATTLASWQGSCRDLTVLFMAACRSLGIASRFTSGYLAPLDDLDQPRELHAWPEVFLPGAGFRGWDPSTGQRVLDRHVALCAAPAQEATMPVEGGYVFEGPSVTTTLDFDLRIRVA